MKAGRAVEPDGPRAPLAFAYDALPGRVVFGAGAARERLAEEVERLGLARVLLVASARERERAEGLAAALGPRLAGVFGEVRPHVPVAVAERAGEAAARAGADGLLAIGGGSTTGTAKAVALAAELPIAAVPTTYAGSEMTPVWGMTEARRKTTGRSRAVLPALVIYDPELTLTLPSRVTGPSAMNAMAHCVEALWAPGANPITSLVAEEGIRALARGLPAVLARPQDLGARTDLLYGAHLAGAAFAVAGSGLHHRLCHALGGAYDLPHAELHAALIPQVTAFQAPAAPEAAARAARALGAAGREGAALGLFALASAAGGPPALRLLGLREADLDAATALAAEAVPPGNPREAGREALRRLLEDAWSGRPPEARPEGAVRSLS